MIKFKVGDTVNTPGGKGKIWQVDVRFTSAGQSEVYYIEVNHELKVYDVSLLSKPNVEAWLNGYTRDNKQVVIGSMPTCVGCGSEIGMSRIVSGYPHSPVPNFPFEKTNCPVCQGKYLKND